MLNGIKDSLGRAGKLVHPIWGNSFLFFIFLGVQFILSISHFSQSPLECNPPSLKRRTLSSQLRDSYSSTPSSLRRKFLALPVALSLWNVLAFSNIVLFSIMFLNLVCVQLCLGGPGDFPRFLPTSQRNFLSWKHYQSERLSFARDPGGHCHGTMEHVSFKGGDSSKHSSRWIWKLGPAPKLMFHTNTQSKSNPAKQFLFGKKGVPWPRPG